MATFWQQTLKSFGLTTISQAEIATTRAYEAGSLDGYFGDQGEDEPPLGTVAQFGYRRQTAKGLRDFTRMSHDQILNTVWALYQANGVAKRGLKFKRVFAIGRNTRPTTQDENLQEILDRFWRCNQMKKRLKQFFTSWSLFGELVLPVFIRQSDGRVKLGYIDPAEIEDVLTHPHNALEQWIIICKYQQNDTKRRIYRIIREDEGYVRANRVVAPRFLEKLVTAEQAQLEPWENIFLEANGLQQYSGSCFYFDKNNMPNQPRGFSDLLQSADSLDQHDETLFALGEREALAAYFSWDVELVDAKPEEVTNRRKTIGKNPPNKKGSINVHNSSEKWQMITADLKQPGTIQSAQALKTHALEGLEQPRHWHGEDDTANRATAESASDPTNKSLEDEQDDAKAMIVKLCEFVRDQAEIAGYWQSQQDIDNTIDVVLPEITKRDYEKVGLTLSQVTSALVIAMLDLKVISRETTAEIMSKIIAEFGVSYNPDEELTRIDEENADEDMATAEKANQFLLDQMNGNNANT